MPSSKTPQRISEELGDLGELYALPRTLDGYSDVTGTNDENGMRYRAMNVNRDLHDWLRSSMQSLLLHVMGEQSSKELNAKTIGEWYGIKDMDNADLTRASVYMKAYNAAITDCLAVIQSTIDSIKE